MELGWLRPGTVRTHKGRPIPPSPSTYKGTLADLYMHHIQPVLPDPEVVRAWHDALADYCRSDHPLFVVRYVKGLERGRIYKMVTGDRLRPSDNAPAWWVHYAVFNGLCVQAADMERVMADVPAHFYDVHRAVPASINTAGWHVAHIWPVKDGNTEWRQWDRDEVVRRFIRNIHPCNCFYVPTNDWQKYGGQSDVIAFFADAYQRRYADVWGDFQRLAQAGPIQLGRPGTEIHYQYSANVVRKPSAPQPPTVPAREKRISMSQPVARYYFSRLCFKADMIEPLEPEDVFEVETPDGTFRMTKAQFYETFDNVVRTRSYRDKGIYHYPTVPSKADSHRV